MAITDNRTTRSTRATYTRLMKHVYAWLQVNYPDSCEDGRILLPLNEKKPEAVDEDDVSFVGDTLLIPKKESSELSFVTGEE